ncbi:MAG: signal recognition particle-docking protein FtsY [Anaerolineales bacterium]
MAANMWQEALRRTRRGPLSRLAGLFGESGPDAEFWSQLEASLIQADVGARTVESLIETLKERTEVAGWTATQALQAGLTPMLRSSLLEPDPELRTPKPHVVLLVGVNGSGKTTTAARLAHRWKNEGASVLLAAADTFRAAATEQLGIWAERLGIPIVSGADGSDPGAVLYSACQKAAADDIDVVIADSSGRMHTSHNLMAELAKLVRVAGKVIDEAPHEVLLVLDATSGQNALAQAESFLEAVPVTGVVLAKLDSSAHGGIAFAVAEQLDLPVQYVGLGETLDDFALFDPDRFVQGLLDTDDDPHDL